MNDKTMPAPTAPNPEGGLQQLQPDYKWVISTSDGDLLAVVYSVRGGKCVAWKDGTYGETPDKDTEYWWINKDGWPDLSKVGGIKIDVPAYYYSQKQDFPWQIKSQTFSCPVGNSLSWSVTPNKYDSSAESYYYRSDSDVLLQLVSKQIPNSSRYSCVGVQWWQPSTVAFGGQRRPIGDYVLFAPGKTMTKQSGKPSSDAYVSKASL
ncbi:hypothetical protein BE20_40680 [Sorangium cellulosum]|uniref:Uncharacterized protein n=1 Tax=Sorangium cellulosum TaxID=56 RepID=A0A150S824_SORCE|nr:hypothetical protein BE18_23390 [Sorangium cellulosum]KYF96858.1 hypothetical protein BE20_40680 [Sorangium cellulosum]